MRFRYLSYIKATRTQASLRKCADSPEPSMLTQTHFRPLDSSLLRLCAYTIRTEITFADSFD